MNQDERRTTWETYASAWRATTREARRAALAVSVDGACVYRDPLSVAEGHDALIDCMEQFHQSVPGGHFETTYFLAHHARSIARWNMRASDGALLGEGISYGEYDARGRLVAMTGFFETQPSPS